MAEKRDALVIIPAYNESENIEKVLEQLNQPQIRDIADVLVINDASTDGMDRKVKALHVPMITQPFNMGYGCALQTGYKYADRHGYKYVLQMDGDGQHDTCNIPHIYGELTRSDQNGRKPDIVLGARFREDSAPFKTTIPKKIAYSVFRRLIKMLTGKRITDPTTGLQGLSRKAFSYYAQFDHFDDQYPDANMLVLMMLLGFEVAEIPAVMHQRTAGKSLHSGLKPFWYMLRVLYSMFVILIEVKLLKMDKDAGQKSVDED